MHHDSCPVCLRRTRAEVNQRLTKELGLKNVSVRVYPDVDKRATMYKAEILFRAEAYCDRRKMEQAYKPAEVEKVIVDQLRADLLEELANYVVEHDAPGLVTLLEKTRIEVFADAARLSAPFSPTS